MKLIRTLIESKRSDTSTTSLRVSGPARKSQLRSSAPVSQALRARSILSEQLDRRLKEFKIDLAELTPQHTPDESGKKRMRVWDLEAEKRAATPEDFAEPPVEETAKPFSAPVSAPFSAPISARLSAPPQEPVAEDDALTVPLHETEPVISERRYSEMRPERKASALRMFEVPDPMQPKRPVTTGRTRTRIMGFGGDASPQDLFDIAEGEANIGLEFPVGWLVITKGHGRGTSFVLQNPVSSIGRGADQTITLNFGDDTISRNNHAAVAYDEQMNTCFIGYGGKANLVRLNGRPVLSTEQLTHGDTIRMGETELRFIALCGPEFSWHEEEDGEDV